MSARLLTGRSESESDPVAAPAGVLNGHTCADQEAPGGGSGLTTALRRQPNFAPGTAPRGRHRVATCFEYLLRGNDNPNAGGIGWLDVSSGGRRPVQRFEHDRLLGSSPCSAGRWGESGCDPWRPAEPRAGLRPRDRRYQLHIVEPWRCELGAAHRHGRYRWPAVSILAAGSGAGTAGSWIYPFVRVLRPIGGVSSGQSRPAGAGYELEQQHAQHPRRRRTGRTHLPLTSYPSTSSSATRPSPRCCSR